MKITPFLLFLILGAFCLLSLPGWAQESASYNHFGGWTRLSAEPRMFFYTKQIDQTWWLIDPGGKAFLSKGVNHISFTADFCPALGLSPYALATQKKYGTEDAWAKAVAANLRLWNFNTIGSWSGESMRRQKMPYTYILDIGSSAGGDWEKGLFPDVYSKKFRQLAAHEAMIQCQSRKEDPYLIGYFSDNELRWGADWRSPDSLLVSFLRLKPGEAGRQAALDFLTRRYPSIDVLNQAWGTQVESFDQLPGSHPIPAGGALKKDEDDFLEQTAEIYFRVCMEEIRNQDSNHLILGCRFAGQAPAPVLRALRNHVDVVTFNTYQERPPEPALREIYQITQKPILITEFSFKAMDSGLPNTKGAGKPAPVQEDRARLFTSFVSELMELPFIIGYHWFEYTDEPAEGRFDGENSNYGLVNIQDEPWEVLTREMSKTNGQIESIHAGISSVP
ncbi:MAG: beta-agarase [bacterium]